MAETLLPSSQSYATAAEKIRNGGLVAFPTETVYGLGANALNAESVLKIFSYKGRPLTDPVIVHILCADDALELIELDEEGVLLFKHLASQFWPGPLTMVAKAKPIIPSLVTAETGFVGVRSPSHPVARDFLAAARVPVAAPSANRFGHVSPTCAEHVVADLGQHPIIVLDGGKCQVGIESTVAKLDTVAKQVVILRRGGISQTAIATFLESVDALKHYSVVAIKKESHTNENDSSVAPGTLLTHYAPNVDTYLVKVQDSVTPLSMAHCIDLSKAVLIDFRGQLQWLSSSVLAYRDMSVTGDMEAAANVLFDLLRWSENVAGVGCVLLYDLSMSSHEHTEAVHDRMFRAASGRRALVARDSLQLYFEDSVSTDQSSASTH
eukprot:GILK01007499.1.p1 GENE.GILK01007499.1~~GILK01007499.1.p1  ORF type:complete len:380 (+),score=38.82 GILK01007499.1:69-1208(+)